MSLPDVNLKTVTMFVSPRLRKQVNLTRKELQVYAQNATAERDTLKAALDALKSKHKGL